MNVWAIIPARGGSRGVPRKNIRPLGGLPLVAYTIRAALASACFSRILVSTEDAEIAEVSRMHGADVPFMRPAGLGTDGSDINDAILDLLDRIEDREGKRPQAWAVLYPTSPFRTPALIRRVIAGLESAVDVTTVMVDRFDLRRLVDVSGDRIVPLVPDGGSGDTMKPAGGISATRFISRDLRGVANLDRFKTGYDAEGRIMQRYIPLENPLSAIDIDTEEDFELAEEVLRRGLFDFELEAVKA